MLDERDLQAIEKIVDDKINVRFKEFEEQILRESTHNMRVILESSIDKKLDLILEALSGHQARIEQLEDKMAGMEALSDDVQVLKSVVKSHSERMDALEKRLA